MPASLCATLLLLALAACANQPPARSVASTPVGTDASTGQSTLSPQGAGPGGINRNYYIGSDPNFPGGRGRSGTR